MVADGLTLWGVEAPRMRTAAECRAKVEDMEKRASECVEPHRSDWLEMAEHWRALEASALHRASSRHSLN